MQLSTATALINHPGLHAAQPNTWADFGCGEGFFTKALSTFLREGSTVYAVDTNAAALKSVALPKGIILNPLLLDFAKDAWPFTKLDGILMANSLHYVKQKELLLDKVKNHLNDNGILLVVDYDTNKANPWVPYPVSYTSLEKLLTQSGFTGVAKLNETPSAFGRVNMYAAIANK